MRKGVKIIYKSNFYFPKFHKYIILNAFDSFFNSQKYFEFSKMDKKNVQFSVFEIFHGKKIQKNHLLR